MPGKDAYALLVQVSADTTKLQKEMTKAKVEMTKTLEEIRKAAGVVEKAAELPGAKRAMESISGNARQLALQSGAARLGIFGDALESLGPLGLTAAAGVGALGAALAGAREAARFADELSDTANKLHVTTDALQEYRFALRLAGGEEKGADEALESFSVTLGKAQQGLQKSQRAFLAIGFTKEQIDGFKTSEEALRAVVERVAEIRNDPQRDAIISQLGLEKMKPLILAGVDALDEFRQQARDTGVVMDAALIARGAELNDQFETLNQVIGVQLKSALVDLGPIISGLLQTLATSIKYVSDLLSAFAAADRKRTDQLEADQRKLGGTVLRFQLKELGGQKLSGTERDYLGQTQRALAKVEAELAVRRISLPAAPSIPTGDLDIGGGRVSGGSSRRSGGAASGRAAQPIRAVEVFDPEVVEILQALEYWQGVEKRSNE
ncbi:MAG: hypothetical protein ACK537_01190, partial [Pseudomonadota bacterium]